LLREFGGVVPKRRVEPPLVVCGSISADKGTDLDRPVILRVSHQPPPDTVEW
jgi:hypothetical protein